MRTLLIASMFSAVFVNGCSQAANNNATPKPTAAPTQPAAVVVSTPAATTASPVIANPSTPPATRVKPLPPEGGDKPTNAAFDGYTYSYKKDGEKTVATFAPKILPSDKDTVAGAVRDVIHRSYGDKVTAEPHIEGTGSAQTIRINGSRHQYIIVPSSEPTGEIHSLIITRVN